MKKLIIALGVTALGVAVSNTVAAASPVCDAQRKAVPNIVQARDKGTPVEDVITAVREGASNQESADVLSESVLAIYADATMDTEAAGEMVEKRCMAAMGG